MQHSYQFMVTSIKDIQKLIQASQFEQALAALQTQLEHEQAQHEKAELLYLKAVCLRLQQRHHLALETLEQQLELQPEHARAFQEQGYNFRALKNTHQASMGFYQATKLNPGLLSAWQALLPLYREAKQSQAVSLCEIQIAKLKSLPREILAATVCWFSRNSIESGSMG